MMNDELRMMNDELEKAGRGMDWFMGGSKNTF
jgi:hypothetical protein